MLFCDSLQAKYVVAKNELILPCDELPLPNYSQRLKRQTTLSYLALICMYYSIQCHSLMMFRIVPFYIRSACPQTGNCLLNVDKSVKKA